MGQVAVESPSTIQWFAEQYSGPNNLVPAAAKVIYKKQCRWLVKEEPRRELFLRGKGGRDRDVLWICLG